MSEELRPCPFCGKPADDRYNRLAKCSNKQCLMNYWIEDDADFYIRDDWNTRPIEDALQSRIAELEMKIRHNALWQASEDAEERAHLEKLVPDLKKRIAELEKAYRWISTTENPPPEDKRFVLAVNATNGKTYYFVLPDLNEPEGAQRVQL